MNEKFVRVTIKGTRETNKGVSNFTVDSDEVDSPFELVSRFIEWFNQENDTDFSVVNNRTEALLDWIREENKNEK